MRLRLLVPFGWQRLRQRLLLVVLLLLRSHELLNLLQRLLWLLLLRRVLLWLASWPRRLGLGRTLLLGVGPLTRHRPSRRMPVCRILLRAMAVLRWGGLLVVVVMVVVVVVGVGVAVVMPVLQRHPRRRLVRIGVTSGCRRRPGVAGGGRMSEGG